MTRGRGPVCGSELSEGFLDSGTLARQQTPQPSPSGSQQSTQEERELMLDLGQLVLDLAGVFDPTPVSDGSNMLISVGRGDWSGAGLSGIGLIPYLGDLAKVGKLGRWAKTIHEALVLARKNAQFAERVRPVFRQLSALLNEVPTRLLPEAARPAMLRMKEGLAGFLGVSTRLSRRSLLDLYLKEWQHYLVRLHLPPAKADSAVLWSRLKDGAAEAERMAKADGGKHTLNLALEDFGFVERYELAQAQLIEALGDSPAIREEIWLHFGRPVWEQISRKYTLTMSGRVTAYVQFGGKKGIDVLDAAYSGYTAKAVGLDPILFDELEFIAESMALNPRITSVNLIDKSSGMSKVLDRISVLRALGQTH